MAISVFILGEARLHREGLALLLGKYPAVEIAGAGGLRDALDLLAGRAIDVILLDSFMPATAALVARLRQARGRLRIVAMGVHEIESEVLACAAAGIDSFIRIDAVIEEVVAAIEGAMRGELLCSPRLAASLYHSVAALGNADPVALTDREIQVVELMDRGLSNKEISSHLKIETCTAKNHVQNILQKLGVHSRGQAVALVRHVIGQRFQ